MYELFGHSLWSAIGCQRKWLSDLRCLANTLACCTCVDLFEFLVSRQNDTSTNSLSQTNRRQMGNGVRTRWNRIARSTSIRCRGTGFSTISANWHERNRARNPRIPQTAAKRLRLPFLGVSRFERAPRAAPLNSETSFTMATRANSLFQTVNYPN